MSSNTVYIRFTSATGEAMAATLDMPAGNARPCLRCYRVTRDGAREMSQHVPCYLDGPERLLLMSRLAHVNAAIVDAIGPTGCRWEMLPDRGLHVIR